MRDDIGEASQGGEFLLLKEFRLQQAELAEYRGDHFEEESAFAEKLRARLDLPAEGEEEFRPPVLPDVLLEIRQARFSNADIAADREAEAVLRSEEMLQELLLPLTADEGLLQRKLTAFDERLDIIGIGLQSELLPIDRAHRPWEKGSVFCIYIETLQSPIYTFTCYSKALS